MKGEAMKCHQCGVSITVYEVGKDYCRPCARRIAERDAQYAKRHVDRFARAKDLTFGGAA